MVLDEPPDRVRGQDQATLYWLRLDIDDERASRGAGGKSPPPPNINLSAEKSYETVEL